jgi:predicted SAM-dependent methyltransferase
VSVLLRYIADQHSYLWSVMESIAHISMAFASPSRGKIRCTVVDGRKKDTVYAHTWSSTRLSHSHPLHCVVRVTLTSNLFVPFLKVSAPTGNSSSLHSPFLVAPR